MMNRLYQILTLVAMATMGAGCSVHKPRASLVHLPVQLVQEMQSAPWVECSGCSTLLAEYVRTTTWELGGKVERPANEHKLEPLVFTEDTREYTGFLGAQCPVVTIEVAKSNFGNPIWRGQGKACYTPGRGRDWEGGHYRAMIDALNNLHQPGQPALAETEPEKKKNGRSSQVF